MSTTTPNNTDFVVPCLLQDVRDRLNFLDGFMGGLGLTVEPFDDGDESVEIRNGDGVPLAVICLSVGIFVVYEMVYIPQVRGDSSDMFTSERATVGGLHEAIAAALGVVIESALSDYHVIQSEKERSGEQVSRALEHNWAARL